MSLSLCTTGDKNVALPAKGKLAFNSYLSVRNYIDLGGSKPDAILSSSCKLK